MPAIDISITGEYIIEAFYCQNIAIIGRVTLIPYNTKVGRHNRAYIDIHEWQPTEAAYNFIQRLKNPNFEARLVHNDDNWWCADINRKPDITHCAKNTKFTTINYLVNATIEPCLHFTLKEAEENDWNEIENLLSHVLAYQNMECQLYV